MKGDEFGFAGLAGNIKNDGIKMKNEIEILEELRVKIIKWADEKGILKKATPEKQFLKFIEETGELAKAILKSDSHEFIDAVGDVFVTIVIHAELCNFKLNIPLKGFGNRVAESISSMVMNIEGNEYRLGIEDLYDLYEAERSLSNNHSFADCVEVAYNVIAGRTGKMVNGTFVKDK